MSSVNPTAPSTIAPGELFSTGASSVQLLFAQLQLKLSQANKEKALEKIDTIQKNQALARETADMIAKARDLQQQVKDNGTSAMPTDSPDMKKFFEDNGLNFVNKYSEADRKKDQEKLADLNKQIAELEKKRYVPISLYKLRQQRTSLESDIKSKTEGALKFDKNDWEYNIKSLSNFQEQIGADTQQLMVFIQDFMGQYNAYLTGANSAIREANQTLATIARGQ